LTKTAEADLEISAKQMAKVLTNHDLVITKENHRIQEVKEALLAKNAMREVTPVLQEALTNQSLMTTKEIVPKAETAVAVPILNHALTAIAIEAKNAALTPTLKQIGLKIVSIKTEMKKRSEQNENSERRTSYPKQQNLDSYTETRFDGGRNMRPRKSSENYDPNAKYSKKKQLEYSKSATDPMQPMRLNKFLANSGLCSRREADEYIKAGVVTVNGEVVSVLGAKVIPASDRVLFHDQLVRSERKVYLLLNKPKDCVTTTEDTNARLTVMDLVKNACSERIYPVGRLDRNTTGVLLLTNDGDMAAKLMHPKYSKKKIYHVHLDKPVTKAHLQEILDGINLEDGPIAADAVDYVSADDKKEVGVEIHSGRNRLVRRIFEHFGYKVMRLDRVYFAGLTKKNLSRGQWRFLTEKEVNILRMGAYE
jgi:23S rRNA pseudouridine2605 synthase